MVSFRPYRLSQGERRLSAIMFTDICYTALAQRNETLSLEILEKHRLLIRPIINRNRGLEIVVDYYFEAGPSTKLSPEALREGLDASWLKAKELMENPTP